MRKERRSKAEFQYQLASFYLAISMRFDINVGQSYINTPRPQIAEIISDINRRIHQPDYAKVVAIVTMAIALASVSLSYIWLGLFLVLLGGLGSRALAYYQRRDRQTTLNYRCDNDYQLRFVTIQKACQILAQSEKIWVEAACKPVGNKGSNAGASQVVSLSKTPVRITCVSPPFIQTNVKIWSIGVGAVSLFFFPDYILLWRKQLYSALSYSAFKIGCDRQHINIAGDLPSDAKILGQTWQHLTPDGQPKPGVRGNQKLFKVQYGLLRLVATIGINLRFYVSNVDQAEQFAQSFCSVQQWLSPRQSWENKRTRPKSSTNSHFGVNKNRPAHEILGVKPNASLADIRTAYHRVARMNHPDKMTGLAPEFRQLAEQRMKVITAAYKVLSNRSRHKETQNTR